MSISNPALFTIVIREIFDAPVRRVFQAWLDPTLLTRWFTAPTAACRIDPVVGGRFEITRIADAAPWQASGQFLVINEPHELVLTFSTSERPDASLITINFSVLPLKGTELVLTHALLVDCAGVAHEWRHRLMELKKLVSQT